MIALELLGVDAQGTTLQLTDSDGNRYSIAITNELRAALRRDIRERTNDAPKPITTREIQAYFRAGKTIDEVSEITNLPPSHLDALAYPIIEERKYTASLAKNFLISRESGSLTLADVVIARLVDRGISPESVTWDAHREVGMPWVLSAQYTISDADFTALWQVDTKNRTLSALNDEAAWLTETQIPAPRSPWRPLNTFSPQLSQSHDAQELQMQSSGGLARRSSDSHTSGAHTRKEDVDIESMLADLEGKRGVPRPMPTFDNDGDAVSNSHNGEAAIERSDNIESCDTPSTSAPRNRSDHEDDAYINKGQHGSVVSLDGFRKSLPDQKSQSIEHTDLDSRSSASHVTMQGSRTKMNSETQPRNTDADALQRSIPGLGSDSDTAGTADTNASRNVKKDKTPQRAKRRSDRPTMPSWDEIVFGVSKDTK